MRRLPKVSLAFLFIFQNNLIQIGICVCVRVCVHVLQANQQWMVIYSYYSLRWCWGMQAPHKHNAHTRVQLDATYYLYPRLYFKYMFINIVFILSAFFFKILWKYELKSKVQSYRDLLRISPTDLMWCIWRKLL